MVGLPESISHQEVPPQLLCIICTVFALLVSFVVKSFNKKCLEGSLWYLWFQAVGLISDFIIPCGGMSNPATSTVLFAKLNANANDNDVRSFVIFILKFVELLQ